MEHSPLTNEQLANFIKQCRTLKSLNFPDIARGLNMNWFKDIKPLLESDKTFLLQMQELVEEMRYHLIGKLQQTALQGKLPGRPVEVGMIKEMIRLIDQGAILGKMRAEDSESREPEMSDVEEAEHKKRLGL